MTTSLAITIIAASVYCALAAPNGGHGVGQARWWTVPVGVGEDPLIVGMPHSEKEQKSFLEALHASNAAGKCGICKLLKIKEGGSDSNVLKVHPVESPGASKSESHSVPVSGHQTAGPAASEGHLQSLSSSGHSHAAPFSVDTSGDNAPHPIKLYNIPASATLNIAPSAGSSPSHTPPETHSAPLPSAGHIGQSAAVERSAPQEQQHNPYKRNAIFPMRLKRHSKISEKNDESDLAAGHMQHDNKGRYTSSPELHN